MAVGKLIRQTDTAGKLILGQPSYSNCPLYERSFRQIDIVYLTWWILLDTQAKNRLSPILVWITQNIANCASTNSYICRRKPGRLRFHDDSKRKIGTLKTWRRATVLNEIEIGRNSTNKDSLRCPERTF